MNIIIKETSEVKSLSIIDPRSGVDYIAYFVGDHGALNDGQFEWDDDREAYVCDQYTFEWWDTVITDQQQLADRIHDLIRKHGYEYVYGVVSGAGSVDLEDHAYAANCALDQVFGDRAINNSDHAKM